MKYLVTDNDGEGHLPYTDDDGKISHTKMGAAWAALHGGYRGNKYEGPGKAEALSKLKGLYKSEGMKTPDEQAEATELSEVKNGLVRVAIAYTGKFEQGEKKFVISAKDLEQMRRNLDERPAFTVRCAETIKDVRPLCGGPYPPLGEPDEHLRLPLEGRRFPPAGRAHDRRRRADRPAISDAHPHRKYPGLRSR